MPPKDFEAISESEARAFLARYVATRLDRLERFIQVVGATGGPARDRLDGSPEPKCFRYAHQHKPLLRDGEIDINVIGIAYGMGVRAAILGTSLEPEALLSVSRVDGATDLVSYDLRVIAERPIDLEAVRTLLAAVDGMEELDHELVWSGTAVTASFLLDPAEIDVGVTSDEASVDVLRAEFLQVLDTVARVGSLVRAPVYDVQLGQALRPRDEEAVTGFAG